MPTCGSDWFTAARIRRLGAALQTITKRRAGVDSATADSLIWAVCGGPVSEVPLYVRVLSDLLYITRTDEGVRVTAKGRKMAAKDERMVAMGISEALLSHGFFHEQSRVLLEYGTQGEAGELVCVHRLVARKCPQLLGVLSTFPGVERRGEEIVMPRELAERVGALWALLPPEATLDVKKAVGDRGEAYSFRLERQRGSQVRWVAREDQTLGYDIEVGPVERSRKIEVKASGRAGTRFILTKNEREKACREGENYEIHFWGEVDLSSAMEDEFRRLTTAGYPKVFPDVRRQLSEGLLQAEAIRWLVVEPSAAAPVE